MGPNGSGKSTLASVLMGNPEYEVTAGRILFNGDDITDGAADVRGKAGIFLAFQYPQEIAGVSVINFLRQALSARKGIDLSVLELRLAIMEWMNRLGMDTSFADRYLNEGFSGGEKKRNEVLQMAHPRARARDPRRDRLRASTSTRCASSPRASTRYGATAPSSGRAPSPTTNACSKSSHPTSCTS